MEATQPVQETSMSWMVCLVKTTLRTALRVDARHMITSASSSFHKVHGIFLSIVLTDSCLYYLTLILLLPCAASAKKGADVCFQYANTQGNLFGNCGINSAGQYIKCPDQ